MRKPLIIDALRHGETVKGKCFLGRTDAELTPFGWDQMAEALQVDKQGEMQKNRNDINLDDYDAIITSPLLRCKSFAEQWIAAKISVNKSIRIDPAIQEYDFGLWDGSTAIDIMQHWPDELGDFWKDPENFPPPQAELLPLFFQRVRQFVDKQLQQPHERILLITHGGVIKVLTCLHQGRPASVMASISAQHGELHRFVWKRQ
ncbi:histidine phosphatase family protein [Neptunomonas sp.]|uniref:histidine phosphatase family protein n=1 Tax=Neptunomonas sp. TaxID=1971898 RepID=UPI003565C7D6